MKREQTTRHVRAQPSRLDAIALDTLALAWLARGMWRASRGRAPWRRRRSR